MTTLGGAARGLLISLIDRGEKEPRWVLTDNSRLGIFGQNYYIKCFQIAVEFVQYGLRSQAVLLHLAREVCSQYLLKASNLGHS